MNIFYIPTKYILIFLFVSLLFFAFGTFLGFLLWMSVFFLIVFAFRKTPVDYKDFLGIDKKIIYSPIQGRVKKINKEFGQIYFKLPLWGPFGFFFPAPCEVLSTEKKIEKKGLFTKLNLKISLMCGPRHLLAMDIESWYLFVAPRMWIVAGDRGRLAANMGMIPFGGTFILTLPTDSQIKVKEGDKVSVGRSIVAGLKD